MLPKHLPKLGTQSNNNDKILFDSRDGKNSGHVIFEKAMKSYVLKVQHPNIFTYQNLQDDKIKGSQVYIQMYLTEKLKMILELVRNEHYYRIVVTPNCAQIYQKKEDEIRMSSAFILTHKWISLCFDVESFFDVGNYQLHMVSIHSGCRLRKIYESLNKSINDGFCLVQRITDKRINELLPVQMRASSEKQEQRKIIVPKRQQTLQNTQTERKSVRCDSNKKYTIKSTQKQRSQDNLLEKTVKLATGLQVIAEVEIKAKGHTPHKPPTFQYKSNAHQKKAVQSFMRHTQDFQNGSHFTDENLKTDIDSHHNMNSDIQQLYYENEYQSKYGRFSSSFQQPLGFSSLNQKQSQQTFYQPEAQEEQIEEQIEVPDNIKMSDEESFELMGNVKQEDSSEELAVSKFE